MRLSIVNSKFSIAETYLQSSCTSFSIILIETCQALLPGLNLALPRLTLAFKVLHLAVSILSGTVPRLTLRFPVTLREASTYQETCAQLLQDIKPQKHTKSARPQSPGLVFLGVSLLLPPVVVPLFGSLFWLLVVCFFGRFVFVVLGESTLSTGSGISTCIVCCWLCLSCSDCYQCSSYSTN